MGWPLLSRPWIAPLCLLLTLAQPACNSKPNDASLRVLVFTKTAGFRHSSIGAGLTAVQDIAERNRIILTQTEDASMFDATALGDFDAVVLLNTTGDVFNSEQELAFQSFIESGGALIGVHAAADTEPDWPFYRELLGAHFVSHPAVQTATLEVEDRMHPATRSLPDPWQHEDEWYNFDRNPRVDAHILLGIDESTYDGGTMGTDHPVAWTRQVGSSRIFYTALGHTEASYAEPEFVSHLEGGLLWALRAPE
jgi:cytochrome c